MLNFKKYMVDSQKALTHNDLNLRWRASLTTQEPTTEGQIWETKRQLSLNLVDDTGENMAAVANRVIYIFLVNMTNMAKFEHALQDYNHNFPRNGWKVISLMIR